MAQLHENFITKCLKSRKIFAMKVWSYMVYTSQYIAMYAIIKLPKWKTQNFQT